MEQRWNFTKQELDVLNAIAAMQISNEKIMSLTKAMIGKNKAKKILKIAAKMNKSLGAMTIVTCY